MDARRGLLSLRTAEGKIVRSWRCPFGLGHQARFAWSPDGTSLALVDESRIAFFDGRTGEESSTELATPTSVGCLAFDPSGKFLATGHADGRVRVWDLKTRALSFEKQLMSAAGVTPEWYVDALAFSPDGRFLAFGIGDDCGVEVLEVSTRTRVQGFECTAGIAGIPREMRWSSDSRRLWFNLCKEGNEVNNLALGENLAPSFNYWGSSPRVSSSGVVVASGEAVVFSLDPQSGRCLWSRPDLAREGELLQALSGHFSGEVDNLDGLTVGIDDIASHQHALAKSVAVLFDPKRVRAARAGVELLPAKL
jgi:WD40 repeat protein